MFCCSFRWHRQNGCLQSVCTEDEAFPCSVIFRAQQRNSFSFKPIHNGYIDDINACGTAFPRSNKKESRTSACKPACRHAPRGHKKDTCIIRGHVVHRQLLLFLQSLLSLCCGAQTTVHHAVHILLSEMAYVTAASMLRPYYTTRTKKNTCPVGIITVKIVLTCFDVCGYCRSIAFDEEIVQGSFCFVKGIVKGPYRPTPILTCCQYHGWNTAWVSSLPLSPQVYHIITQQEYATSLLIQQSTR